VPFLAALLRYSLLASSGAGQTTEDALTDRFVLGCTEAWVVLLAGGLYVP
jgi:hypothetical protein